MLAVRFAQTAPDHDPDERERLMEAHRAHLRSGAIAIVQSGPLYASAAAGPPVAALVIAEVSSLDELRAFSDADPFVIHRIYDRVTITRWDRTIG